MGSAGEVGAVVVAAVQDHLRCADGMDNISVAAQSGLFDGDGG